MGVNEALPRGPQNSPVNGLRTRMRRGMLPGTPPHIG